MRRACVVLLAGCGFQSPSTGKLVVTGDAAAAIDTGPQLTCWRIVGTNRTFEASACVTSLDATLDVQANLDIDTDAGTSLPAGVSCATLAVGSSSVCALTARTIRIRSGATVSAHGARPLALLAHDLTIEGVVDVASHIGGIPQAKGAAADRDGCQLMAAALGNGGGAGGTYEDGASAGGDGGTSSFVGSMGGVAGTSIGAVSLLGGCPGAPSSGGSLAVPPLIGGHSGGAVWIGTDTGTLALTGSATVNASGAAGAGGLAAAANRGGNGGGSGGLIVLSAPVITRDPGAKILANGGGGGAGSFGGGSGPPGKDPTDPGSGGDGGNGAKAGTQHAGDGGRGFPAGGGGPNGQSGNDDLAGGGGGGGGAGAIRVASPSTVAGDNVSPPPVKLN